MKWFGSNTDFDDHKQSEDRLRTQLARLNLLDRTTRAIGERQDLRSIFQVVVRSLEDHLPIDFGCVCLHDPAQESLIVTCLGTKSRPLARELAMSEQARIDIDRNGLSRCGGGQLVYDPDMGRSEFPLQQRLARAGLRSLVVAPLVVERNLFGVMMTARRAPESFDVILLTGWGHHLLAKNEAPEHVDRILGKPPRLAELRMALAELTIACASNSLP